MDSSLGALEGCYACYLSYLSRGRNLVFSPSAFTSTESVMAAEGREPTRGILVILRVFEHECVMRSAAGSHFQSFPPSSS